MRANRKKTKAFSRREFLKEGGLFLGAALGSAVFLNACTSTRTETTTQEFTKIVTNPPDTVTVPTTVTLSPVTVTQTAPPVTITIEKTIPPTTSTTAVSSSWPVNLSLDSVRLRHLLRRAGFGASQAELDSYTGMGLAAVPNYLLEFQNVDDSAAQARVTALNVNTKSLSSLQQWWLLLMVYTKRPLQEKMVLFWHGLLTSGFSKVGNGQYMLTQNQFFRDQALGDYAALLKAVSRDPAMMTWLDSQTNNKVAPNENFARELMELFTLGIGNYTENDVREAARAFTGWSLRSGAFYFDAANHDNGTKNFLGQSGNFNGDDIIDIILQQPAAATFISKKLFEFFAYANPDANILSHLANIFTQSTRSIKAVVKEILTSDAFYSSNAYRGKVKSPAEMVVGMVRELGMATDASQLVSPLNNMGQSLFDPPDVSGWKGDANWFNSGTMINRLNLANLVATARQTGFIFDPSALPRQQGISKASDIIDYYTGLLIDGVIPGAERTIIANYTSGLGTITTPPATKTSDDEKLRSLVYLILSSPDYQLA